MRVRRISSRPRRGTTLVETAIVLPVLFTCILGTCVIGLGIYRYQQVASLAREGARYASVHGNQYSQYAGASVTASAIYNAAIKPMAVGLDTNTSDAHHLTYQVQWGTAVTGSWVWTDWDTSTPTPASYNPNSTPPGEPLYNAVRVTVTYPWVPEMYLAGPINLTSTSIMPMSF